MRPRRLYSTTNPRPPTHRCCGSAVPPCGTPAPAGNSGSSAIWTPPSSGTVLVSSSGTGSTRATPTSVRRLDGSYECSCARPGRKGNSSFARCTRSTTGGGRRAHQPGLCSGHGPDDRPGATGGQCALVVGIAARSSRGSECGVAVPVDEPVQHQPVHVGERESGDLGDAHPEASPSGRAPTW